MCVIIITENIANTNYFGWHETTNISNAHWRRRLSHSAVAILPLHLWGLYP